MLLIMCQCLMGGSVFKEAGSIHFKYRVKFIVEVDICQPGVLIDMFIFVVV